MFAFEGYTLDIMRCSLRVADREIALRPKSFDVLRYLVENADRVVTRDELIKAVWPGLIVTDDSLTQCVSDARQVLGDDRQTIIRTVPRRGYRFAATVSRLVAHGAFAPLSARRETAWAPEANAKPEGDPTLRNRPAMCDHPAIAVLRFDNLGGDPRQDYLGDGIVEEIITALSRTNWLFVAARNSSFTYKGRPVDVKQVGRELGVHYVLEGSVRQAASRLRITCQLIDTGNGMHIWANRYDGAVDDIFDLQDEVTANVVNAIAWRLQRAAVERSKRNPPENITSRDYLLRGMTNFHRLNADANNDALRHFNKAIALDPAFATAYGMAAWCYVWRIIYGWMIDPAQECAEAVRLARSAIELGRDDAIALGCAGWTLGFVGGELEAGVVFVDRARALNPHFAPNWYFSGWLRSFLGHPEAAIPHFAQLMRLCPSDPLVVHCENGTAWAHFVSGRYDEALVWAERTLQDNPQHKPALRIAAASKARLGRRDEARNAMVRMGQLDPAFRMRDVRKVAPFRREEDLEMLEDNLHKAGLPE